MAVEVSVDELRENPASVIQRIEAGETVVLTVDRRPVADIVPHGAARSPWISAAATRSLVEESAADTRLRNDIAAVQTETVADPWEAMAGWMDEGDDATPVDIDEIVYGRKG